MDYRFKKLFFILAIPIILGGIIHYTLSFQIKNILEVLVEKESENTYAFNASKIEVSFWNKTLLVENAKFISLDSLKAKTHYNVEIPKMHIGIQSWSDILFKRKISIDSLSFLDSKIRIHEKTLQKTSAKTNLNLKEVFKTFENILNFLEVKSFTFANGSFVYKTIHTEKELSGQGINFSIQNLSQKNKKGHLLYTDDILIDIKNQQWNMPDGLHTVSFKSLTFSGKNSFFELDSFTIKSLPKGGKGGLALYSDKFFFNSVEFGSMYETNTLKIDTLLCIRPVLTLDFDKSKPNSADSTKSFSRLLPELFNASYINYINIEDGQILLKKEKKDSSNALVQKSNLKIYNLSLVANRNPILKTDSILFGLKDIKFITPDNTYEIVASELMIINNDLVLRNSSFGPVQTNIKGKNISFSAPEFRLKNINFENLIQKRLKATQAELYSPKIIITSAKKSQIKPDTSVATIEHFYSSLHGFKELVGVEQLRIINGNIHIKNSDKHNTTMTLNGIDALILPIHFVNSSALLDIKYSLPKIEVAKVVIESDQIGIVINHFSFDGVNKKNDADYIHLKIKNELDIEGSNIHWESFNWDSFQKYKRIDIQTFSAQRLAIKSHISQVTKSNNNSGKKLPDIHIGKLNVNQLSLNSVIANDSLSFSGKNIFIDSLHTVKRFFAWEKVSGNIEHIHFYNKELTATIQSLQFNTSGETLIQDLFFNKNELGAIANVTVPSISIHGSIYSTDFSNLNILNMHIRNPVIRYSSVTNNTKKSSAKKAIVVPINIRAKELIVSNAQINYNNVHANDTLSMNGLYTIKLENIVSSAANDNIASFDKLDIEIQKLIVTKNTLSIEIPSLSIQSRNGSFKTLRNNALAFQSDLQIDWQGINISKSTINKNGIVRLENISGSFTKNSFIYETDKSAAWISILNHLTIDKGTIRFLNDVAELRVNEIKWENKKNTLSFNDISYHPRLSLEDAIKNASTQFDYLSLTGKSIQLKNIKFGSNQSDSIIHIENIILNQLNLSSTRDKNVAKKSGKLKEMPTKIIQAIDWPLTIDTIKVTNSNVVVNQIEANTYAKASIPITNINATITNITNKAHTTDSLYLRASASILGVAINSFKYTESYSDSLSYFQASSNIVPGNFTELNTLTTPLANLAIDNGYSNKLNAVWSGNKYATIGEMNFIYKNLHVHLLNKKDTSKTNIALKIENTIANDVINKNNKKSSVIFFERNPEKQIFNYWLKATLQGIYSSVGIKSNEKYLNQYKKIKVKYNLP